MCQNNGSKPQTEDGQHKVHRFGPIFCLCSLCWDIGPLFCARWRSRQAGPYGSAEVGASSARRPSSRAAAASTLPRVPGLRSSFSKVSNDPNMAVSINWGSFW